MLVFRRMEFWTKQQKLHRPFVAGGLRKNEFSGRRQSGPAAHRLTHRCDTVIVACLQLLPCSSCLAAVALQPCDRSGRTSVGSGSANPYHERRTPLICPTASHLSFDPHHVAPRSFDPSTVAICRHATTRWRPGQAGTVSVAWGAPLCRLRELVDGFRAGGREQLLARRMQNASGAAASTGRHSSPKKVA
ncbi:hypothetical protein TBK1r_27940 [Stieleria magnilauensis]|uniref:Uncharacterized protein n=1 Tax=Stieleria magnilauensis TaxID=2527963 RepID=A0ABX5XT81_9BACT|nr:hypothetical protein TBK1r_27940 [Planctomycetes bacterium TBK1r]